MVLPKVTAELDKFFHDFGFTICILKKKKKIFLRDKSMRFSNVSKQLRNGNVLGINGNKHFYVLFHTQSANKVSIYLEKPFGKHSYIRPPLK